jgi:hypothetical protein
MAKISVPTSWESVTVRQYQQLTDLYLEHGNSELDLIVKSAYILTGKEEKYWDSLTISELNEVGKMLSFTHHEIKPKPVAHINVNSRRFRCVYDVRRLPCARYIETKVFTGQGTVTAKLHQIAASMVYPQKKFAGFMWWVDDEYRAELHEDYAADMLDAHITAVLGSVVFFCEIYLKSIWSLKHYLVKELTSKTKMPTPDAKHIVEALCSSTGGIIPSSWWLNMSESQLNQHGTYQPSTS